jgi:5'-phosphate synthase pdxT subunit
MEAATPHNGSKIGVLAIQGDFDAHVRALGRVGATPLLIKNAWQLAEADGLVLPGGESTTARKFLHEDGLLEGIRQMAGRGRPIFGTCAGAILLARQVSNSVTHNLVVADNEPVLQLMDIGIRRNAYGRQLSSFIARQQPPPALAGEPLELVFIRAPLIERTGPGVQVLLEHNGWPVLVRQGSLLAATFHPELTEDPRIHLYFMQMVRSER